MSPRGLETAKHEKSCGSCSEGPSRGIIEGFRWSELSEWSAHECSQAQLKLSRRQNTTTCKAVPSIPNSWSPYRRCEVKLHLDDTAFTRQSGVMTAVSVGVGGQSEESVAVAVEPQSRGVLAQTCVRRAHRGKFEEERDSRTNWRRSDTGLESRGELHQKPHGLNCRPLEHSSQSRSLMADG